MEAIPTDFRGDYLVNLRFGWLHYQNAHYDRAETFYRQALAATADKSIEAMLGLTLPLAARDQWNEVEGFIAKSSSSIRDITRPTCASGQILSNRGDYAQAEKYLATALTHYPAEYEANLAAAWNTYALGKRAGSSRDFRTRFDAQPRRHQCAARPVVG